MAEKKNDQQGADNGVRFFGVDEIIEIREEDTQPSTGSESHRQRLREKYGAKEPPANGPASRPPAP
jgi:hypothetical protein